MKDLYAVIRDGLPGEIWGPPRREVWIAIRADGIPDIDPIATAAIICRCHPAIAAMASALCAFFGETASLQLKSDMKRRVSGSRSIGDTFLPRSPGPGRQTKDPSWYTRWLRTAFGPSAAFHGLAHQKISLSVVEP